MSYHGNNFDCLLYIGTASASSSAALPSYAADSFTEIGMTGKIKLPVYERSVGRFNVLNDDNRRAVSGKLGDQDCSGDIVLGVNDGEATHNTMFADVNTGNIYRNWRVVTPVGEIHEFKGFLSRWERDEYDASTDAAEVHAQFNIAVDVKPTVTP